MKLTRCLLAACLLVAVAARCRGDEIIKTDGEVLVGTLVAVRPGHDAKIRVRQKVYEIRWDEIRRMEVGPSGEEARPRKRAFDEKSWYLNPMELGFAALAYPPKMDELLDGLRNLPDQQGEDRLSISLLGIYFPVGVQRRALLGLVVTEGIADGIFQANNQWQVNEYIYSLSGMYFLTGKIGDGLYVKGNLGMAAVDFSGPGGYNDVSSGGLGVSAELGYVFSTGRFVRPLVNARYSLEDLGAGNVYASSGVYQSLSLNFGILW